MVTPEITLLYAGLLGILAIGLGATAGLQRAKTNISIGDGGDQELLRACGVTPTLSKTYRSR